VYLTPVHEGAYSFAQRGSAQRAYSILAASSCSPWLDPSCGSGLMRVVPLIRRQSVLAWPNSWPANSIDDLRRRTKEEYGIEASKGKAGLYTEFVKTTGERAARSLKLYDWREGCRQTGAKWGTIGLDLVRMVAYDKRRCQPCTEHGKNSKFCLRHIPCDASHWLRNRRSVASGVSCVGENIMLSVIPRTRARALDGNFWRTSMCCGPVTTEYNLR